MKQLYVVAALAVLVACGGRKQESSGQEPGSASGAAPGGSASAHGAPVPGDASTADANLETCRTAAARVPSLPRTQRMMALLVGCQPCGDWTPVLSWSLPPAKGGPTREAIQNGLLACNAFCDSTAKQRFLSALDAARVENTRTPWRQLGEICGAAVSAVPDTRYMNAPYFALDRIARMVGDAALLGAIELPLPAVSLNGVGVELPTSPLIAPDAGPAALTVDADGFFAGTLPSAKLSSEGVKVAGDYPGARIAADGVAGALGKLAGKSTALLASRELPAGRIVDAVAAAGDRDVRLAVGDLELLHWTIPGTVPIALTVKPSRGARIALDAAPYEAIRTAKATPRAELLRAPVTIAVAESATVAGLANLLAALGFSDVKSVALVKAPPAGKPARPAKP